MKKMRFSAAVLLAALLMCLLSPAAAALDEPQADSSHAIVLVAERGTNETVLYTRNENERMSPASVTKIMTVLLAIEAIERGQAQLDDLVTAQDDLYSDIYGDSSSVYTSIGETMTLESLLYCAMVASSNETCNVIATYIGGSISNFLDMMNQRAVELGCTNTHFANTHGLTDPDHYTTAWDLSRILREAASHELFMTVSGTVNYTVPGTNMNGERLLENTNSLINPTNYLYPGDYGYEYALGGKTGHTSAAGYCLAATAEKDDVLLLCVILNAEAYQLDDGTWYYGSFADAKALFEWAYANFSYQEIVRSTEIVDELPVEMGSDAATVSIRPSTSISAFLPNDVDLDAFERTITLYPGEAGEALVAPVSAAQEVGEIAVSLNGVEYGRAKLVTTTSVDLSRTQYMRNQLKDTLRTPTVVITFWALVLFFLTYLLLVIRYRAKRRAYQKRLANARQIRLDLEDEEEELRYERRVRSSAPAARKNEVVMEPESYQARQAQEDTPAPPTGESPDGAAAVDEPTRLSGELPEVSPEQPDEPTRVSGELPVPPEKEEESEQVRDYFEEFFGKQ